MASSAPYPERLRMLVVMARPLYPADTGGRIRSSKMFERLSRQHDITIACFRTAQDGIGQIEAMRACCSRLETVEWAETPKFTPRFYAELATSAFSPLPYTVRKYRSRRMQERLALLTAREHYDLLLCDFLQPSVNCLSVPLRPKVLFQHNVEAMIRQRQVEHESRPVARAFLSQEARKLLRFERHAAAAMDLCIMVSDEDARTMAAEYGINHTAAIPTGVDVDYFRPLDDAEVRGRLVFTGSMDWLPNQDAVRFFVADILPRVRRQVDATFVVAGRNPPQDIRKLASDVVQITGTVDDIRPHLGQSEVCVVPIRIGGGTRIKIFEAMAMGKAVVATPIGAEGLPVRNGRDIVLETDPDAFAAAVVRLLTNPPERRRLAEAGRQLVAERHTWDVAAARFSEVCGEVVRRVRTEKR